MTDESIERKAATLTALACLFVIIALSINGVCARHPLPYGEGEQELVRIALLRGLGLFHPVAFLTRLLPIYHSFITPQLVLFLLLPSYFATIQTYGFLLVACTYIPLAYGCYKLCSSIKHREWAPTLFLFIAVNNYSFDLPNLFQLYMQAAAFSICFFASVCRAWSRGDMPGLKTCLLLSFIFWINPWVGFFTTLSFIVAHFFRALVIHAGNISNLQLKPKKIPLLYVIALPILTFLPYADSLKSGLMQDIFDVYSAAPFTNFNPYVDALYYPLCLSYFYNFEILSVLAVVLPLGIAALTPSHHRRDRIILSPPFPVGLSRTNLLSLGAINLSCLILFSLFQLSLFFQPLGVAPMIFTAPLVLLLVFPLLSCFYYPPKTLLVLACCWAVAVTSQARYGWDYNAFVAPKSYSIGRDITFRFPSSWGSVANATEMPAAQNIILSSFPSGTKIAVSSRALHLDCAPMDWYLNAPYLSAGLKPPFEVGQAFDSRDRLRQNVLVDAGALACNFESENQYTRAHLVGLPKWIEDHLIGTGAAKEFPWTNEDGISGIVFIFPDKFTVESFNQLTRPTKDDHELNHIKYQPPNEKPVHP